MYKTQHRKLEPNQHEPHTKTRGDLMCSWMVSRSCSTCSVSHVITNPVNSLIRLVTSVKREQDCINHIRNISDTIYEMIPLRLYPTRDGVYKIYEGRISTSPYGSLGVIASFWAATRYQGNRNRKYKPGK